METPADLGRALLLKGWAAAEGWGGSDERVEDSCWAGIGDGAGEEEKTGSSWLCSEWQFLRVEAWGGAAE